MRHETLRLQSSTIVGGARSPPTRSDVGPFGAQGRSAMCNAGAVSCLTLPPGSKVSGRDQKPVRHVLTKPSSNECHCSRSCATTCQEPLGKPSFLKKYSSNASDHLLQGCPRLRRPSGAHDNNCDDHLPSVLRAKCPAHLQCFLLTAATQSSKPARWQCSSATCVVRRIHSTQSS